MRKINKKSLCLAAAALILSVGVSAGSAMAYFSTYATAAGGAAIHMGGSKIIPNETVSDWTKHVTVENTGDADCYVRVKAFAGEKYQEGLTYSDETGRWTPGEDGYYYYSEIVPAGQTAEELLIRIDNMESTEDFNVIVVTECTDVVYSEDGSPMADWSRIADVSKTVSTNGQEGE